jgi:hypothetical protein
VWQGVARLCAHGVPWVFSSCFTGVCDSLSPDAGDTDPAEPVMGAGMRRYDEGVVLIAVWDGGGSQGGGRVGLGSRHCVEISATGKSAELFSWPFRRDLARTEIGRVLVSAKWKLPAGWRCFGPGVGGAAVPTRHATAMVCCFSS